MTPEKCKKICEEQLEFCKAFAMKRGGNTCRIIPLNKNALNLPAPLYYDKSHDVYMKIEFQPKRHASSVVKIHLNDVNEAPRMKSGVRYVEENAPAKTIIGAPILAPDDDNDAVKFKMQGWFSQTPLWGENAYGSDYNGDKKISLSGKKCLSWTASAFAKDLDKKGDHNSCRNPDNSKLGPWCFTDNGNREECFAYHDGANDKIQVTSKGYLKVRHNSLDFEKTSSYTLIITSYDDNQAGSMVTTKPVTVFLVDINEPPVMLDQSRDCNETHDIGHNIGAPLKASDIDAGQVLRMVITGGDPKYLRLQ
jgi:hypothetical protein